MEQWQPVTRSRFLTFSAGLAFFVVVLLRSEPGWVRVLDGANLLFHEAGHLFFGILGDTMGLYGGTLGQFVFPSIVIVGFWRQRATLSLAVGWIWFFENFFNVARYMADARALELPLVGGGDHDWSNIFWRWGVLHHDTHIAQAVAISGWIGMVLVWLWVAWRTVRSRHVPEQGDL